MQLQTVWRDRDLKRLCNETVETVRTSGDTCKYKLIVWRDRERDLWRLKRQ